MSFWLIFISGLSLGLLGSFHCIGMCGPLALAIPVHNKNTLKKALGIIFYNLGRCLSYTSMGIAVGLIGRSFSLFNLQQYLSITAGILILTILIFSRSKGINFSLFNKFTNKIKHKLVLSLNADKKAYNYLYIGILNGLLPCGLVYIAISTSLSAGTILKSSIMMFAFGLGTFPVMALLMVFGKYISFKVRLSINKLTPYFIMIVSCLLILRGLNLDIPYISPAVKTYKTPTEVTAPVISCHK